MCLTKARKYILRKLYKEEKLLRMMNTLDGNYFTPFSKLLCICKYALRTFLLLLFLIISSVRVRLLLLTLYTHAPGGTHCSWPHSTYPEMRIIQLMTR